MRQYILELIISIPGILMAFTVHEYAHAKTSYMLGDDTPYFQGRVTLNPLSHIDILGFISILFFRFGWAKPVQVNKRAYKNYRRDDLLVSFAGPFANFILSVILELIKVIFLRYTINSFDKSSVQLVFGFLQYAVQINMVLFFLNLMPIPGFDGYHILKDIFPGFFRKLPYDIERYSIFIFMLCVIPLPMINGSIFQYLVGYPASKTLVFIENIFFALIM
ncbi:Zn-dependent protease (includes SpoIVFB) [Hathewaya proteolytica DSM 3090]|uniref:Zn-dependent protease (Includes SpoIVFB) n=1 Tax=Hathewaya proteolytica DSM 3090 TaxID=1121331 RepID=A0A1M6Q643_9CLOT|nr:site-2 protease family protein [Hathewaya proteolytica]SHK15671.1 Zn-dependent protease (includes SpoIVFB) [Hathewaya proteolytica DSM 3090]